METQYASPERETLEVLNKQKVIFDKRETLRYFLDMMPVHVAVLNDKRQIVFGNQNLLASLNKDHQDNILGLRTGEAVNCIHSTETEGGCGTTEFCRTCGAVNATLSSQTGNGDIQECRISITTSDALDFLVWASPINLEGYDFTIFAFVDISHEKRRNFLEKIFFHDILNTAGSLRSFSQLIAIADNPEEQLEYAQIINKISSNLIEEIQAQRDLVAAETGELTVVVNSVKSLEALQDAKSTFNHKEKFENKKIIIAESAVDFEILTDKTLLRRVLVNLTKNALEAVEDGETVLLNSFPLSDGAIFTVHNNGAMPHNVQLQIFQRSFSTKGEGRGLGTYSVKLLTQKYLKGEVSFTSNTEAGTTFKVRLFNNLK